AMESVLRQRVAVGAAIAAVVVAALVIGLGHAATPTGRAATSSTSTDTVSVTGEGTADGAPDTLTVSFTVHATRATVQDALDAQAADARKLFAALQNAGVARKNLQTTDLSLDRHYTSNGTPSGYDASETVSAKISPLGHAGATISAGARSAGNDVSV